MCKCKRRGIQLISLIMIFLFLLTGCSTEDDLSEKSTYDKVVIGSDRFEPYIYQDENGDFTGVDAELATKALHRMGYEPEFKQIVWEDKKECLADGTVDCLWGCFSMNGREDEYQWAGPYLYSSQVVVVRKNSDIQDISDLNGRIIALQETGKAEEYFLYPDNQSVPDVKKVYAFSDMDEVYSALRKNYVEAICGHESALNSLVSTAPNEYRMLDKSLFSSKLGVAFSKEYDETFVQRLTNTLDEMLKDGTTKKIVERYGLNSDKALAGGNWNGKYFQTENKENCHSGYDYFIRCSGVASA